jgi:NADPH2:quinone reductase
MALIRVKAAAVNFADSLVVAGQYQVKPDLPFAPGSELAGEVIDTGGIDGLTPGARVAGFIGFGAMAELALVPANALLPLGPETSFEEGASIPVAYGTSYHALVDRARLQPGETLLVLGASGGVGVAAVQIGKRLGATVIGAVSSDEKEKLAVENGADHVIRYDRAPLRDGIAELTGGTGVDVVYDPVGGPATEQALRSTKWDGRLLVIGFAAGEIPSIPLNLPLVKGNSIVGVFWGRHLSEDPTGEAANFKTILQWVSEGTLRPVVTKSFPLEQGADALRWVAERKALGRVIVAP